VFAEALEMTAFALDEFAARAARYRFRLVLLLHESFAARGDAAIRAMADERGIPVIGQREYISSIGGDPRTRGFPTTGTGRRPVTAGSRRPFGDTWRSIRRRADARRPDGATPGEGGSGGEARP